MTLTRLLPTLRRSLPEPLHPVDWPAHTRATLDDLVVAGVSMVRLAAWCGTPCVHTDEALSVIVTRVQHREQHADGTVALWFDADLETVAADPGQARLLARVTSAPVQRMRIGTRGVDLPGDLAIGDLVAMPARALVTLHEIDPRRRRSPRAGEGAADQEWSGRCGR